MTDERADATPNEDPANPEVPPVGDETQPVATPSDVPVETERTATGSPTISDESAQTRPTVDEQPTHKMARDAADEDTQITHVAEHPEAVPVTPQQAQADKFFDDHTDPAHATPYPEAVPTTPYYGAPAQHAYEPQPGHPSQPGYPPYTSAPSQPGGQTPARKRRGALVGMIIVAIVAFLLGGGSVLAYTSIQANAQAQALVQAQALSHTQIQDVLQKYCDGVKTANAQEIYDTLSSDAKTHSSLNDIQRIFDGLNSLNALDPNSSIKLSDCTSSNIKLSDKLATATVAVTISSTFNGQTTSTATPSLVSLVPEQNQWKIDFSGLTQPQVSPNFSGGGIQPTPTPSN